MLYYVISGKFPLFLLFISYFQQFIWSNSFKDKLLDFFLFKKVVGKVENLTNYITKKKIIIRPKTMRENFFSDFFDFLIFEKKGVVFRV